MRIMIDDRLKRLTLSIESKEAPCAECKHFVAERSFCGVAGERLASTVVEACNTEQRYAPKDG